MDTLNVCKNCPEYGSHFCEDCMEEIYSMEQMMMKEKVLDALHNGICVITFTKKNGEERVMSCTLNEEILPKQIDLEEAIQKKKPNPEVLAVWDTAANGWRSFRWDSVKDFKAEIKQ